MDELHEIIEKLPKKVREIFYSDEYLAKLKALSDKHGLNVEQSGILLEEVVYTMAGLTHPDDFVDEIRAELKIPKEKATLIAKDVDSEILHGIREELMRIYDGEEVGDDSPGKRKDAVAPKDRDTILGEIENPTPITKVGEFREVHTIVKNGELATVTSNGSISEDVREVRNLLEEIEAPSPATARRSVLEDKLGQGVRIPSEEKTEEPKSEWKQPIDPYREPLS